MNLDEKVRPQRWDVIIFLRKKTEHVSEKYLKNFVTSNLIYFLKNLIIIPN